MSRVSFCAFSVVVALTSSVFGQSPQQEIVRDNCAVAQNSCRNEKDFAECSKEINIEMKNTAIDRRNDCIAAGATATNLSAGDAQGQLGNVDSDAAELFYAAGEPPFTVGEADWDAGDILWIAGQFGDATTHFANGEPEYQDAESWYKVAWPAFYTSTDYYMEAYELFDQWIGA